MLQPLRYIQYTAIMNITVITSIMAIIILLLIIIILDNKAIQAGAELGQAQD